MHPNAPTRKQIESLHERVEHTRELLYFESLSPKASEADRAEAARRAGELSEVLRILSVLPPVFDDLPKIQAESHKRELRLSAQVANLRQALHDLVAINNEQLAVQARGPQELPFAMARAVNAIAATHDPNPAWLQEVLATIEREPELPGWPDEEEFEKINTISRLSLARATVRATKDALLHSVKMAVSPFL